MENNDKIISFGSVKAERSGDCKNWTALDALKETIREIESGEMEMDSLVILGWATKNGTSEFFQRYSGVNHADAAAMLALGQHNNLNSWN